MPVQSYRPPEQDRRSTLSMTSTVTGLPERYRPLDQVGPDEQTDQPGWRFGKAGKEHQRQQNAEEAAAHDPLPMTERADADAEDQPRDALQQ